MNSTASEGYAIDLRREEGARTLNKEYFLFKEVDNLVKIIKYYLNNNRISNNKENSKTSDIKEFFATNVFVSGSRGTGKTSILLTAIKEIKNEYKDEVDILGPIDLSVNYTGIVFYILSHLKLKIEEEFKSTDCCSSSKLEGYFDKLINNFPKFLKCFCTNDCGFLCNEELEILLDQHEINFLKDFFNFIDEIFENKKLILFLDDIDLIPEPKILLRTIIELAVFLNHPKIIIVGAGDIENLKIRLLNALINQDRKTLDYKKIKNLYEEMVLSLLDKIFPLTNRVILSKITPQLLEKLRIITKKESERSLKDFLKGHFSFKHLKDDNYKYLLSDISLRELVQILRTIEKQIAFFKEENGEKEIRVKDILVSRILLNIFYEDFIINLKTDFDIKLKKGSNGYDYEIDAKPSELEEANFEAFISFLQILREIIAKTSTDYLNGNQSVFSLFFKYNPKLGYLINLWANELNLYLMGNIYFNPLVSLIFYLIQGLHMSFLEDSNE